jgi:hypothetical protein
MLFIYLLVFVYRVGPRAVRVLCAYRIAVSHASLRVTRAVRTRCRAPFAYVAHLATHSSCVIRARD